MIIDQLLAPFKGSNLYEGTSTFDASIPRMPPMTIAIGAICENSQTIVIASDHMITYGPPFNLQTETALLKSMRIHESCLAICTGSVSDGEEVLRKSKPHTASTISIRDVAEQIKIHYSEHKIQRVEETILKPAAGITHAGFQQMVVATPINHLIIQLANAVFNHSLGVDILIAGIDDDGPSLWSVNHPGIVNSLNMVGYAALGSGGSFATARLGLSHQAKSTTLAETVYNVYEAKRAAELGPAVGRLTDMAIIKNSVIKYLPDSFISHLETVHQRIAVLPAADIAAIQERCTSALQ